MTTPRSSKISLKKEYYLYTYTLYYRRLIEGVQKSCIFVSLLNENKVIGFDIFLQSDPELYTDAWRVEFR